MTNLRGILLRHKTEDVFYTGFGSVKTIVMRFRKWANDGHELKGVESSAVLRVWRRFWRKISAFFLNRW